MQDEGRAQAHVLIEQGYDSSIDGDAYASIFFQNANHSVRVTDDFMRAVVEDKDWWTKNVLDGQPNEKLRARDLMMKIRIRPGIAAIRGCNTTRR